MRTEKEMFDLILGIAKEDSRIRAVVMNGSRANPNVIKDEHQDFDIVYIVTETESFLKDKNWICKFGEIAIMQEPCLNDISLGIEHDFTRSYGWLMLFKDGIRIDLYIEIKGERDEDSLTVVLLDKDNLLSHVKPPSDKGYLVNKPTLEKYNGCCNNFWWCLNNVAKGIVREQYPYAMRMYHETCHNELDKMLDWFIGTRTDFSVNTGMWGKYFEKYLPVEYYELYEKTYGDFDDLWECAFTACELFRLTATHVAEHFGYKYNKSDDENIMIYMNRLKNQAEYSRN